MLIRYCFKYYDGRRWRCWCGCFYWNGENDSDGLPSFLKNMGEACPFFGENKGKESDCK